jgi:hypothetical protein
VHVEGAVGDPQKDRRARRVHGAQHQNRPQKRAWHSFTSARSPPDDLDRDGPSPQT